jgi:hypothetical protein
MRSAFTMKLLADFFVKCVGFRGERKTLWELLERLDGFNQSGFPAHRALIR